MKKSKKAKTSGGISTHLADVVISATGFFANCPDDTLDPDLAVSKLEEIAGCLKGMDKATHAAFVRYVAERAEDAQSPEAREFLSTLCENLGL